jgi:hypothetical protein
MPNLNKPIDKAQQEAAKIQSQGFKEYIFTKKTSMSLAAFLIIVATSFIIGAILF